MTEDEAFEEPLLKLRQEILAIEGYGPEVDRKRAKLEAQLQALQVEIFSSLTPWQETLLARHPQRPYLLDYAKHLFTDFTEFHGDRRFADDSSIVTAFAYYHGQPVLVVGHQTGRNAKERVQRNFGMPRPEGYRKALRLMQLADKFGRPILAFINTPGAYPGIEAEERGQAEAIARNILEMSRMSVPIVVTIVGEGGSGGALAIGVGDRVLMLEHSIYSVISPEGCAAILWRDPAFKKEAAKALCLTAKDLHELGIIDEIVKEPVGGAHSNAEEAAKLVDQAIARNLADVERLTTDARLQARYDKFRRMGRFEERPHA